jgi:hypothetical protein
MSAGVATADGGIIYKCLRADGRVEYSNVYCGPGEVLDYITGDTFSVYSRGQGSAQPPLSDAAIRRQQRMADEARERAEAAARQRQ